MNKLGHLSILSILFLLPLALGLRQAEAGSLQRADMKPVRVGSGAGAGDSSQSDHSSRKARMMRLLKIHNLRFDQAGQYIDSGEMTARFDAEQDRFISEMRNEHAMQPFLWVGNDMAKNDFIRTSILLSEQSEVLALVIEKADYKDQFYRSILRVFSVENLVDSQVMIGIKETPAFLGKLRLTADPNQIDLKISVVENLRQAKYRDLSLQLLRSADGVWSAIDLLNQKIVKKMYLTTWMGIFPPNGGVKDLQMDSRGPVNSQMDHFN